MNVPCSPDEAVKRIASYRSILFAIAGFALLLSPGLCFAGTNNTAAENNDSALQQSAPVPSGFASVAWNATLEAVNHSHLTLKGCVVSSKAGMELRADNHQVYQLTGNIAGLQPGHLVKVHGSRAKKAGEKGEPTFFAVEALQLLDGPCE
jgi:hypothetical protein